MCDSLSEPQKNGPKVAETGERGEIREELYQSEEQDEWQAGRDLTTDWLFVFECSQGASLICAGQSKVLCGLKIP